MSENEMVERVARAIAQELDRQEWASIHKPYDGREIGVDGSIDLQKVARAAIEAMREPTKEMLSEGAFYHIKHAGAAGNVELGLARDAYKAMIAAALKD